MRNLQDEELTFNYNEEKRSLTISAGRKKYKMSCDNPSDFKPRVVPEENRTIVNCMASEIVEAIKTTSKIIKWDDMRPELAGVTILSTDGDVSVSGTHEAFYFYLESTGIKVDNPVGVVLPKDVCGAISAARASGEVEFIFGARSMSLTLDGFEYHSTLLDPRAPLNLDKYFAYEKESFIVVDREELGMALKRMSSYTPDGKALIISIAGEEMKLESEDELSNMDAEEIIDVVNRGTKDVTIGLNVRYLMSILSNMEGDNVRIHVKAHNHPIYLMDDDNVSESKRWGCALIAFKKKV